MPKYNKSTGKEEWDENEQCQRNDKLQEDDEVDDTFYIGRKLFF